MLLFYENYIRQEFMEPRGVYSVDELYIVLSGSFRCRLEGIEYIAKENDVMTIPKNCYFEREVLAPVHYLYMHFDEFPMPLKPGVNQVNDLVRLQNTSRYLELAFKSRDPKKIEHYSNDIFYLCNDAEDIPVSAEDDVARRCLAYMRANYSNHDLNLDFLAKKYNISKNNLINKYKRTYHKTPMADLVDIRIKKSTLFLRRPQYPVHWIAKQCGFENTYYFSNTFKKKTGISPSKFRQLAAEDRTAARISDWSGLQAKQDTTVDNK